ncbi:hypothetical protein [Fluviispira sanaruensis]|uniref:Uncharacterized protein n=1 Tax=Fluviispira sanaruensis TaxID=2493639 RepID=A0A4V0P2J1_FLUSA|nr:hypothetical protein [Fluviispira sanaruensis]BBH53407.1 hypothetical protein JCM31447_18500 [Fluviispira sanaruensis]
MDKNDLDMLSISAYADSSHARDRELWRGFLSYALPVVMAYDPSKIDKNLAEAVVYSLHELTVKTGKSSSKAELLRSISILLAKEIGVSQEFALASFFEGEMPATRLYKINYRPMKKSAKVHQEDALIGGWLADLAKVQSDKKFLKTVEKWRKWMETENDDEHKEAS